jgi:hypothetical protein
MNDKNQAPHPSKGGEYRYKSAFISLQQLENGLV